MRRPSRLSEAARLLLVRVEAERARNTTNLQDNGVYLPLWIQNMIKRVEQLHGVPFEKNVLQHGVSSVCLTPSSRLLAETSAVSLLQPNTNTPLGF